MERLQNGHRQYKWDEEQSGVEGEREEKGIRTAVLDCLVARRENGRVGSGFGKVLRMRRLPFWSGKARGETG